CRSREPLLGVGFGGGDCARAAVGTMDAATSTPVAAIISRRAFMVAFSPAGEDQCHHRAARRRRESGSAPYRPTGLARGPAGRSPLAAGWSSRPIWFAASPALPCGD